MSSDRDKWIRSNNEHCDIEEGRWRDGLYEEMIIREQREKRNKRKE